MTRRRTRRRRTKRPKPEEENPKGTPVPQKRVGDIPVEVYDNGDGYDCHYKAEAGKTTIKVKLNGQKVAKSPYTLEFEDDANSDNTGVENFCFIVEAKNSLG